MAPDADTAEAIEHYLMARRDMRSSSYQSMCWAVAGFAQCLELAPHFLPAPSMHIEREVWYLRPSLA